MRHVVIAGFLAVLLGCNPSFAQVGGIGNLPPGMGLTSPFGMSSATGPVGPAGVPLGATELPTPGLSPAPAAPSGTGLTVCSGMAGAITGAGLFDGGGLGTAAAMSPMTMGAANSSSASACNQAASAGGAATVPSTTASSGSAAPLGIGTIPMGSTELGSAGVSPAPCPLGGPTLPTDGSVTASGAC
jgi:hypothetical protein